MTERNDGIQHLRAVAILFVLCHHWAWLGGSSALSKAWSGVDLFFVISGYVVFSSFFKTLPEMNMNQPFAERLITSKRAILAFYVRRFWRIIPPLVIVLVAALLLSIFFNSLGKFSTPENIFKEIVASLTFTYNYVVYNNGPFRLDILWSLSVEEHFYLLFPLFCIIFYTPSKKLYAGMGIFLLVALIIRPLYIRYNAQVTGDWLAVRFTSHNRIDSIMAGVIMGQLFMLGMGEGIGRLPALWTRTIALFCLSLLVCVPAYLPIHISHNLGFVVMSVASAILVSLAIKGAVPIFPFAPLRKVLSYIGSRSYGIYLVHRVIGGIYPEINMRLQGFLQNLLELGVTPRLIDGLIHISLTLVIVEAIYWAVEVPCMARGREISKKLLQST